MTGGRLEAKYYAHVRRHMSDFSVLTRCYLGAVRYRNLQYDLQHRTKSWLLSFPGVAGSNVIVDFWSKQTMQRFFLNKHVNKHD